MISDMDPFLAKGIAEGRIHPETKEELEDLWPYYDPGVNLTARAQTTLSVGKPVQVS
jgi:hypothetical protein